MPHNLPFEIQAEIIKRLPMKSLIQFRSVCQAWKSLIESSHFIADYSGHLTQVQRLLIRYEDPLDYEEKYVSIVDDDTFPQQKVSLTVPDSVMMFNDSKIIGSSHGLLCFYGTTIYSGLGKYEVVLWNISIRKAIAVAVRNGTYLPIIGFGVSHDTNDIKIVKIAYSDMESEISIPYEVEVFTLSTGAWRSPHGNLPRKSIEFHNHSVAVMDGVVYWLATDRITVDGGFSDYHLIVSFDITSEEFIEISLPDALASVTVQLSLSKIKESLVVLEYDGAVADDFVVWMMGDGIPKSFTKLFTFPSYDNQLVPGFRSSGEPIIEIPNQRYERGRLVVYEPYSKYINDIGIDGRVDSFSVYPYTETLLLLDQPDRMVYDNI